MKRHTRLIIGIVAVIAVTSIGGAFAVQNLYQDVKGTAPKSNYERVAALGKLKSNGSELVIRAFTIGSDGDHGKERSFTGTLQPRYTASVGFRLAGKILERKVELGQRIRKGDLLFRLDPEDVELQLRVAEAEQISAQSLLTQAKAEERRQSQLRSSGSASQSEYDLATATLAVSSARLDSSARRLKLAENQRSYCDLAADSDGLVLAIQAEAGQVVNIGQPVLQVMQQTELEASVNLPEGVAAELLNAKATVRFWSRKDVELRSELRELSPVADPSSRTYDARFRLIDPADGLTIGMTATVVLREADSDGITIPLAAISSRNDIPVVWRVVDGNRVEAVPVELLQYKSETAIVRGSLKPADQIVSAGVQRIDENVTVRVWEGT